MSHLDELVLDVGSLCRACHFASQCGSADQNVAYADLAAAVRLTVIACEALYDHAGKLDFAVEEDAVVRNEYAVEEYNDIDVGNKVYGGHDLPATFDRVFVPNDRIFLNGEVKFAGMIVERFAGYHRQSYGGCKVGVGDVLIGATALAGEMAGSAKASHVKDKLIEMTHLNETLYCCGIACSSQGTKTKAGNYLIDLLLANVCKQNVTRFPYEIARLAQDLAGGLMVTQPSEADVTATRLSSCYIEKYLKGVASVPTEDRMRLLRLIENMTMGTAAVGYLPESMHGAGSPQAQRIMIARQSNLEMKKELAKKIARIQ